MPQLSYTRDDTNLIKGLGILLIILHNFFHTLPAYQVTPEEGIECEFDFRAERISRFFEILVQGDLLDIIFVLFSFLGHYGVALFVFISGYGLVKRYENRKESGWTIVKRHTFQLWKWLIPMLLFYILCRYLGMGQHEYASEWELWKNVLLIATFTSNLVGKYFIISGPWWYFGMAFQLYLFYAWVARHASDNTLYRIAGGALILQLGLSLAGQDETLFYLRYNCIGWLPVFCLGMWIARHPIFLSWQWMSAGILLCIPSLFVPHLWIFSSLLVLFPLLASLPLLQNKIASRGWRFIGSISVALFVLNSFVRKQLLNTLPTYTSQQALLAGVIFLILCISAASIYYYTLRWAYRKLDW